MSKVNTLCQRFRVPILVFLESGLHDGTMLENDRWKLSPAEGKGPPNVQGKICFSNPSSYSKRRIC
jgi:hypothetical protein